MERRHRQRLWSFSRLVMGVPKICFIEGYSQGWTYVSISHSLPYLPVKPIFQCLLTLEPNPEWGPFPHELCVYLGTKLRELMLKNNQDFGAVEMELKKFKTDTMGQRKAGQWVTKHHLMTTLNWTKTHACKHKLTIINIFVCKTYSIHF